LVIVRCLFFRTSNAPHGQKNRRRPDLERHFLFFPRPSCSWPRRRSAREPYSGGPSIWRRRCFGQSGPQPSTRGDTGESRTFVPTDIRSHAIFDRAGHSCSHQMTTWTFVLTSNYHPDIRAHIKLPPRTFVLISTSFNVDKSSK